MNISSKYDVVIIGGGPAGCSTALMLNKLSKLKVLVLESGHYAKQRAGESIPPDTRLLFKQLNIWQEFLSDDHDPCLGSSSVWGHSELGYNDYIFNPMGHGWHLNRKKFDRFFSQQLKNRNIDHLQDTKVYKSQIIDDRHVLSIKAKNGFTFQLESSFVVDAGGFNSSFAKKQGARKKTDDELVCITSFYQQINRNDIKQLTLLEATEYGWWYAAQLPNNTLAIALACDKSFSKFFQINKHINWFKLLKNSSINIYKAMNKSQYIQDSIRVNSISSYVLDQIVGKSWLATGDAACAFDPISAGGIYKALTHGISAAKTICDYFNGNNFALRSYSNMIQSDFQHYLENKRYLYQKEKRWKKSPFWIHRQAYKKSDGIAQVQTADLTL